MVTEGNVCTVRAGSPASLILRGERVRPSPPADQLDDRQGMMAFVKLATQVLEVG